MPTVKPEPTDTALEAQVFWLRYRAVIVAIAGIIVVGLLCFAGYRFYRERLNAAAATAFASARTAADLQALINQYPRTPAAASSLLLLADEQRKAGKFAEAISTLQTFVQQFPRHELVSTAKMATAANLESLNKLDEAAAVYQQIAATNADTFNAPLALLAQVEILRAKKRDDEARRICETILSQYQESYAAMEATRLLRALKPAKSVSATPTPPLPVPPAGHQP